MPGSLGGGPRGDGQEFAQVGMRDGNDGGTPGIEMRRGLLVSFGNARGSE
jgi:hypothetical protein